MVDLQDLFVIEFLVQRFIILLGGHDPFKEIDTIEEHLHQHAALAGRLTDNTTRFEEHFTQLILVLLNGYLVPHK